MKKFTFVTSKIVMTIILCFLIGIAYTGLLQVTLPDPNSPSKEVVRLLNGPKSLIVLLGSVLIMYWSQNQSDKYFLKS